MQPNMKKEYRAELKTLGRKRRILDRSRVQGEKNARRNVKEIERQLARDDRQYTRELIRTERRIAILQGRLL